MFFPPYKASALLGAAVASFFSFSIAQATDSNFPLQPDMAFTYENAHAVDASNLDGGTVTPTAGSNIPNPTLINLEQSSVEFAMGMGGTSAIHLPLQPTNPFSQVSFWIKADHIQPGTLGLKLTDSQGNAFLCGLSPTPKNWTHVIMLLRNFNPVDTSLAGRMQMLTLPLTDVSLTFAPQNQLFGTDMQVHLGTFTFGNSDPNERRVYPYSEGANNPGMLKPVNWKPLDYSYLLPPDLAKTYFLAMVYDLSNDGPYQWYDASDKFQLTTEGQGQGVFKDVNRLCLVQEKEGNFDGRYRFGTIVTDKVKLNGGEIFEVEYAAAGLAIDNNANRLKLEFADGTSSDITESNPLVSDGAKHLIRYSLPSEDAGKTLVDLRVLFGNSGQGWAELDLHTLAILRHDVDNRIDADKILATAPQQDVHLEFPHNVPVITINGQPISGMGFANQSTNNASDAYWNAMLNEIDCPTPLARVVIPLTEDVYLLATPNIWVGPNDFDYSFLDDQMGRITKVSPTAKFMIYLQVDGMKWWNYLHPNAQGVDAQRGIPDFLSEEWKTDLRGAIRQLVAHIRMQPYANAVIGYQVWGGSTLDTNLEINDATPSALARFRDFLHNKYQTEAALQKAWNQPSVTFANAIPDPLISEAHPYDRSNPMTLLVDPSTRRPYLDRYEFRSHVYQQNLINICADIKEATQNRVITGARTGNFIGGQCFSFDTGFGDTNYEPNIDLLLKSPAFDLFELQEPYPGRSLGYDGGIGTPNIPPLGAAMNHKLIMVQNDYPWGYNVGASMAERRKHTRRVYAHAIMDGLYPYEWCVGESDYTFNKPELIEEYKTISPVFTKAVQCDRSSVAEMAVVCDLDYKKYLGYDAAFKNPARTIALFDVARYTWARAGMPFDMIFMDQLAQAKPYKLYIFFHTFELTPEKQQEVEDIVRKKGAVAIFIWADFLMNGNKIDPEAMSNLIGMKIKEAVDNRRWRFEPAPWFAQAMNPSLLYPLGDIDRFQNQSWQPGIPKPTDNLYSPSFTVEDPSAISIATYEGSDDVSTAYKKTGNGTSFYSASATLSPSLLRYAGKLAGCFQYLDTEDACCVDKSFVFIHAGQSGMVNLSLPTGSPLYEVFSHQEYPSSTQFQIPVQKDNTYLFYRGDQATWDQIKDK